MFADGRGLLGNLVASYEAVDEVGILGGNLRGLYAEFLSEADRLTNHELTGAAEAYRSAAARWADFGAVCHAVPLVKQIVEFDSARRAAVDRGEAGSGQAASAATRSLELLAGPEIGLDGAGRLQLFGEMSDALVAAHAAEVGALAQLTDAMR